MPTPAISTQNLTRRFGTQTAVDALTLDIAPGAIFGMLGHNGAGKTTTVRLLNGILAPSAGTATVLGLNPATDGPQLRAHTGVLTENPALDDRLSARKTLRLFAEIYGVPHAERNRRCDELLELFGLASRANDKVGGFSKGMRQRMAIARTLLHNPQILFLDEPTAALDPVATREVHQLIRDSVANAQRTVFLCTHNLHEAQRLCTHVAVLARGRLLATGTPAQLTARYGGLQRLTITTDPAQAEAAAALLRRPPWWATIDTPPIDTPPIDTPPIDTGPREHNSNQTPGRLHIQGIPAPAIPDAIAALVGHGIRIHEVMREEATLEDVYFALQTEGAPAPTTDEAHP